MASTNHNWQSWHWPWWTVSEPDLDYGLPLYSHFAGFGPFQWNWYNTTKCRFCLGLRRDTWLRNRVKKSEFKQAYSGSLTRLDRLLLYFFYRKPR